jgi:uncharacterized protein YndB with AHSA1/START domain
MTLAYQLERRLTIRAPRDTVFRYFTDSSRWAAWWGAGSTIDARPGGQVFIRHPDGTETVGEVLEAISPERLVFTYGFAKGTPIPPGGSRVTIRLDAQGDATELRLVHEFPNQPVRDEHVQGWRFQLSLFANLILNDLHGDRTQVVDAWFEAWAERDAARRAEILERIAVRDVRMRDRFSFLEGQEDLTLQIGAAQRFMPGIQLKRDGAVRHSAGQLLADWVMTGPDGNVRGRGTNFYALAPDGRIEAVTGFWTPSNP